MSVSQPSREIYVIDVPEIKGFEAIYHYNFFVVDESINETGGIPSNLLERSGAEVDGNFIQYSTTRVPRLVEFRWSKPKLADVGNAVSEQSQRNNAFRTSGDQNGSLILDNLDKIVSEDDFASNNFASVHFHDGEIDEKVHALVSGSMLTLMLDEERDTNTSAYRAAQQLVPVLPDHIKPHFIFNAMTQPKQAYGADFYVPFSSTNGRSARGGLLSPGQGTRVLNTYFDSLKKVSINTQINTKLMHDLVSRTISDPTAPQASDLVNMHQYSKQVKQATNQRFSPAIAENDYKTFVPFIKVKKHGGSSHVEKYGAEIVGFVIDKFEILPDGSTRAHPPIVVDNPHVNVSADLQIKFNASYCYTIRTIALLTTPAINEDTGDVATIKVLVSSKPTNKIYVSTLKLDPPPPPADLNFIWNYETDKLMVIWAFPTNSQRDIKQFQVFRRESIDESYELQKVYNFDDSLVPFDTGEDPDGMLAERLASPATFWTDDEFDWNVNTSSEKGLIYSVCCIDAHGLTSNYSAQFRVWFDRFKNKLDKEIVSHAGAPKPYPNLYLEGELFTNTVKVAGTYSKRMKLYFNPEYYYLTDDQGRVTKVLQTQQTGGSYRLQFVNIDNLKDATIDINIDDRTQMMSRKIAYPTVRFGPKRKNLPGDA